MSIQKTAYLIEQINKLKDKAYEIALLLPLLIDSDLNDVRPFTLYPVLRSPGHYYFVDLYYPDLKIAIEIDEGHHKGQKEEDSERQAIIERVEMCEFKRIPITTDLNIYEKIKELKEFVVSKREVSKKNGHFKEWKIITHTMEQVQKEYPNAIFFKTTKLSIDNSFDPTRGPILISEEKRKEANLFVTYSADTVTKVCSLNYDDWREFPDKSLGFYQIGQEVPNHSLLSSGTTQWGTTSNRILGENLKK